MVINPSQFVRKSNPFAKCGRIGYQGEIFRKVMEYSNMYPPKEGGKPRSQAGAGGLGASVAGAVVRKRGGRPGKYGLGGGAIKSGSSSHGLARQGLASRSRGSPQGPSGGTLHVPPVGEWSPTLDSKTVFISRNLCMQI